MNLESRLIFCWMVGLVATAGLACGPPPPDDSPPELVEEEESETSDGAEVRDDVASEEQPEPISVGCDPRAPGVPCCTTTLSEEIGAGTLQPYVPWAVRRDGVELDLAPMSATTFEGRFGGLAELDGSVDLECPIGAAKAGLDCTPDHALVLDLPDGEQLELILPFEADDLALEEGDEVEIDFAEGLRLWDDHRNIVLHLYRPPVEPWLTFERVYGPLRISLAPQADDFSTAICITGADTDCGGVRIERLVVEGDERTLLDSGQATMPAGDREFRVYHLFSAQPLQRDDACSGRPAPQPAYAVIQID